MVAQILAWADAHHQRTGKWPIAESGSIVEAPGETWKGVSMALVKGLRGLLGGSSLTKLLAEHRGVRNTQDLPLLTIAQILAWADEYRQQTGEWPSINSGPVNGTSGETWSSIQSALCRGVRGLSGVSSLAQLLAEHRGRRNQKNQPLTVEQILAWADSHYNGTREWPRRDSGPILEALGENWRKVDNALRLGLRGLSGGSSLARLIREHRAVTST